MGSRTDQAMLLAGLERVVKHFVDANKPEYGYMERAREWIDKYGHGREDSHAYSADRAAEHTPFRGHLRFVYFASYETFGPTLMVYTQGAWDRDEIDHKDNPGPIGFIPLSEMEKQP